MAAWKELERRIARILGGRRVGPAGVATEDVEHPWLAIECKFRKELPRWLHHAIGQAEGAANGTGKLPLAILHEKGARWPDDFVVMRLGDFVDWFDPQYDDVRDREGQSNE